MERATELLSLITYKPGWTFELREMPNGIFFVPLSENTRWLHITAKLPHVRNPKAIIDITLHEPLTEAQIKKMDAVAFLAWVRDQVMRLETHECDEWLKLGGKNLSDPHPHMIYFDLYGNGPVEVALDGKLQRSLPG